MLGMITENISSFSNSINTIIDVKLNYKNGYQSVTIAFSPHYVGQILILIECTDLNKNLGNQHSRKVARFFYNHFTVITNIKPVSFKKIQISFDSIVNKNNFLNSNSLISQYSIYSYLLIWCDKIKQFCFKRTMLGMTTEPNSY